MRQGRRYDNENKKLNLKKILAVIIAIAVLVMVVLAIKEILKKDTETGKVVATSYFSVYTNGKWGVIDSLGNIIIEPEYDEMILIPNNKKDIFICTYNVNYETGEYKTKVLDKKGKEIFKNYDKVEAIDNFDESNNIYYEDNVLKVQKDGKWGMINFEGQELILCEYENIVSLKHVTDSILIQRNGKLGLVDNKGNIIIEAKYQEIRPINNDYKAGYIVLNEANNYGIIGFDKTVILQEQYEDIKDITGNSLYYVQEGAIWKIIDETIQTVLESDFDDIQEINGENIIITKAGKYGLINTDKEKLIKEEYDELKYAFGDYYIAKKNDKYGLIDKQAKTLMEFKYSYIDYRKEASIIEAVREDLISELYNTELELKLEGIVSEVNIEKGYMKIRKDGEYKYYNFKFEEKSNIEILTSNDIFLSKKDGKYGYTDKYGNIVVEYIYDDGTEQNSFGFASIKKDGKWGSIDRTGKVALEPKYELKDNLIIDFIGKWHLGQDLNMNYYTDK